MDERAVTLRPPVWALITAVVIGGLFYIGGKHIETEYREMPATISVTGEGKVSAIPDVAEITLGVQTKRMETSDAVMAQLEKNMNAALKAVKAAGIEDKDISTQQLSMYPVNDWTQNGQVFRGYEGSQSLMIKVRDTAKVGDVISAATRAGANQVGGINFTVDEPKALQAEARQKAIEDAKAQAQKLADQLGVELGNLMNFSENGGYYPPMAYARMDAGMGGSAGGAMPETLPLPVGQQDITVNVTMTYEIDE